MTADMVNLTQEQVRLLLTQTHAACEFWREQYETMEGAMGKYREACCHQFGVIAELYDMLGLMGADEQYGHLGIDTKLMARLAREEREKLEGGQKS